MSDEVTVHVTLANCYGCDPEGARLREGLPGDPDCEVCNGTGMVDLAGVDPVMVALSTFSSQSYTGQDLTPSQESAARKLLQERFGDKFEIQRD